MVLPEVLAIGGTFTRLARELAKSVEIREALGEAGVHQMPQLFVLPIAIPRRLEQDGQEAGIDFRARRDLEGVLI